jgi:hypothetical protein
MDNEEQSQGHAHQFFDIKGIVHKEFVLAGKRVNSTYYHDVFGDQVEKCHDFAQNFGEK